MFAGKKSAQIREILISESAWEEMTCLFAPSLGESNKQLNILGWIMDVIQDGDFMQQLLVMNDDEIYQSIYIRLSERGEL